MILPPWIGPYRVSHSLGRGNQGQVCLAHCGVTGEPVAIKISHGVLTGIALERTQREFRLSATLDDPAIPRPRQLGTLEDGRTYFVTEYVDGTHLWKWRRTLPSVGTAQRTARVGRRLHQLAQILARVHAKGIVHGDVKLSAAMLDHRAPRMWLLDFGGAVEEADSQSGRYFGTARYSAPEQLDKRALTTAADIWSFGVVGTLLSSGKWPLRGSRAAVHKQLSNDPSLVQRALHAVDGDLSPILSRCLTGDVGRRPTAQWLVDALGRWASPWSESDVPEPYPSLGARLSKNCGPNDWKAEVESGGVSGSAGETVGSAEGSEAMPGRAQSPNVTGAIFRQPRKELSAAGAAARARARAVLSDERCGAIIALTAGDVATDAHRQALEQLVREVQDDARRTRAVVRTSALGPEDGDASPAAARWRQLRTWLAKPTPSGPPTAILHGSVAELAQWVIKDHQLHHIDLLATAEGDPTFIDRVAPPAPRLTPDTPPLNHSIVEQLLTQGRLDTLETRLLAELERPQPQPPQLLTWWAELQQARSQQAADGHRGDR